jgi:glycosyltransferase involved in cell wall biosynthesis
MVYWFYPPVIGGVEIYLENLSRYLAKRGTKIELLTGPVKGAKKIQRLGGLTVRRIPGLGINGKEDLQKKGYDLMKILQDIIQERDIDIVSSHNFHLDVCPSHTLAVNAACLNTGTPLVNTLHNYCESKLDRSILCNLMWSRVIGTTRNMAEHAYEAGVSIEKISCVYNGINIKRYRPGINESWLRNRYNIKEKDFVIVCPTRLIYNSTGSPAFERKGLVTLLKALSIVIQSKKNIKLLVTGAPPNPLFLHEYRAIIKRLKDMARIYGIGNKLIIMEGVKSKFMPALYNGSDLMVLVSRDEPFGLAYVEAMACEVPVIGAGSGGVPEIIQNGVNGYLVPNDDHVELSKRILWIIEDRKKKESFGKNGRKIAIKNFSLRKMTEETMKVYESVVK